jgi:hypothetical protein
MQRSPITQVLAVVAAAIAGWSWFDYAPPFSWIADGQIALFGFYHPVLAFVGTVLLLFVPLGLVALVFRVTLGARGDDDGRLADFVAGHRGLLAALTIGVVITFMGGRDWIDSTRIGSVCTPMTLASLTDGHTPASRWVELSGYVPDRDRAVSLVEGSTERDYVPLVVRSTSETPVVVVDAASYELDAIASGAPLRGVLRSDRVPGDVRARLSEAGLARGSYWLLDLNDSPEMRAAMGRVLTPLGLLLLIGALVYGWRAWRETA